MYARSRPTFAGVGTTERLGLVLESVDHAVVSQHVSLRAERSRKLQDSHNGTENLISVELRLIRNGSEDGRSDEVALVSDSLASNFELAVLLSNVDEAKNSLALDVVGLRTVLHPVCQLATRRRVGESSDGPEGGLAVERVTVDVGRKLFLRMIVLSVLLRATEECSNSP